MEPYELPSNTALKIKVRRVVVTAKWKWVGTTDDDSCGICRMPFDACCVDCKVPGDECPVVSGVCTHMFHIHCIERWTDSQQNNSTEVRARCPLCRQPWEFKH
ncbi:hypothetical protein QR680_013288 [Steinernema hermaphroditum]|uniref:Anaphase-promoting complex subunit 11 n=1 Tax=Steinernema hermaphroditum TaxID=289476 RepID=A0AA39I503_9BILA|nr:hypothetical protein QR680_013288 [Steinernema hermaphroditum]